MKILISRLFMDGCTINIQRFENKRPIFMNSFVTRSDGMNN